MELFPLIAYDEDALGFHKGDLLVVEEKTETGNWRGKIVKESSTMSKGKPVEYSKSGSSSPSLSSPLDFQEN